MNDMIECLTMMKHEIKFVFGFLSIVVSAWVGQPQAMIELMWTILILDFWLVRKILDGPILIDKAIPRPLY